MPTNYLHTPIGDISDPAFQQMVAELYHCVNWQRHDGEHATLFYLLSSIGIRDRKSLAARFLPTEGILTAKVARLPSGPVRDCCAELVLLARLPLEAVDSKSVLALINRCFPWKPRKVRRN